MQTQGPELLMKAGGYVEDNRVEEEEEKKKKRVESLFLDSLVKISPDTRCY